MTTQLIDDPRTAALRLTASAVAVAGMLPYLALKIVWLTGGSLGIDDPGVLADGAFFGLNLLTFGMDAVALLIALAFVRPWGRRIPAGLILLPIWVGIGLLSTILVQVPLSSLVGVFSGTPLVQPGGPVAGWVYLVVYTGFCCQGIGLMIGFQYHARRRWPWVFTSRTSDGAADATRELQLFVARGTVVVAGVLAVVNLAWLLGATYGLPAETIARRTFAFHLSSGINAALAVAAAAGLLVIARGRSQRPLWVPVTLAWVGSGAMFGWSLYGMIITLVPNPLNPGGDQGITGLVMLFTLLTGTIVGLTGIFALAGRAR
ncbi:hypothetical protein [Planomonospora venezuelensis]|uniref:LigA protein n=1 Tax=Planomonospora venezuelensis TaxID=1999 RepID=A0A841DCA0_PLAVE|nr:hypothetical protein [Planomonospora venezuelensis]MBB5965735.1 hypothetical protein [Planomonospora venezuelensis]GIN05834.1 hypothetical protein Pve01_74920 [Planomonospora venezuelensis]